MAYGENVALKPVILVQCDIPSQFNVANPVNNTFLDHFPWRIHGAAIYANIDWGYIDGIHVNIYSSTMDPMGLDTWGL